MVEPLTHARIGYDSITRRGTVVASSETSGFPATSAQNELTYSYWRAGLPATWEIQLDTPETVDYFGIAAHDLGEQGIYATLQALIDAEWQTMRVLAPGVLGDVFGFDGSLTGLRGTVVSGGSSGSMCVGIAGDLREVVGVAVLPDSGGSAVNSNVGKSKLGTHALTVEPAVDNLFPENVRTATDSGGDTTGFTPDDGAATLTSDDEHFVRGSKSLKMVASGATGFSITQAVDASATYTFSCKVLADVLGGSLQAYVYDGTTLFQSTTVDYYTDNLGKWMHISYTVTVGGSATSANFGLAVNAATTVWVGDFQLEEGDTSHTWANGSRAAGDLSYVPELVQQFEDCTVNLWVRAPAGLVGNRAVLGARDLSTDVFFDLRAVDADIETNLLPNPGFEDSEDSEAGWTLTDAAVINNTSDAHAGDWYALVENAGNVLSDAYPVVSGQPCVASAWAMRTVTAATDAVLAILFYDSDDNFISQAQASLAMTTSYQEVSLSGVVAPASATSLRVQVSSSEPLAFMRVDDLSVGVGRVLAFGTGSADGNDHLGVDDPLDGEWHMLTAVLHATAEGAEPTKRLYWDGVLVDSSSTTEHIPTWQQISSLQVGHYNGAEMIGPEMLLDDLTVVNYAATQAQVTAWFDRTESMVLEGAELPPQADDRPIMRLVEATKASRFRVSLVGTGTATIGVISIGKALEMPRPIYGGHTPISLARSTVVRPNVSERGQWLGRSIIRTGASGSWSWQHLTADWVRRYLDAFMESARTHPFFILWRPESFPLEAAYCWTLDDLSATNMGVRDLMSFSLDAEGLGHE